MTTDKKPWLAFTALLIALLHTACVSNKKLAYLQPAPGTDTTQVRTYDMQGYKYLLKPSDLVAIDIFSTTDEELNFLANSGATDASSNNHIYMVNQAGYLKLPVVEDIKVGGLSLEACQEVVQQAYQAHLESPIVRASLMSFEYTILGEVNAPGNYRSQKPEINIFEALGTAGDLSRYANRENIRVMRTLENNQRQLTEISLLDDSILGSEHFYIMPGDVLIVDPLKAKGVRQDQLLIVSTIVGMLGTLTLLFNTIFR
ncbi:MAG: polysaccharide biosynthesis/export family protein [Bacteroidota bacterium]